MIGTSKLEWECSAGHVAGWQDEPPAKYLVHQIGRRRSASVLTEAGPVSFNRQFPTLEAAQRFCETDAKRWRRLARESEQPDREKSIMAKAKSWRDVLPIHPAAELFPMMSEAELRELGEDIMKNGLTSCIAIKATKRRRGWTYALLDGRNRLDAMELVGIPFNLDLTDNGECFIEGIPRWICDSTSMAWGVLGDPYAYVISANLHRRHLTTEQKRELIEKLVKATPDKSDRQIAETTKTSPTTVGRVRKGMEAKGDVSNLDTRIDKSGRRQAAHKSTRTVRTVRKPTLDVVCADISTQIAAAAYDLTVSKRAELFNYLRTTIANLEREAETNGEYVARDPISDAKSIDDCLVTIYDLTMDTMRKISSDDERMQLRERLRDLVDIVDRVEITERAKKNNSNYATECLKDLAKAT